MYYVKIKNGRYVLVYWFPHVHTPIHTYTHPYTHKHTHTRTPTHPPTTTPTHTPIPTHPHTHIPPHLFFTEFSVRPGILWAILAHWLPHRACISRSVASSSAENRLVETSGLSCCSHRSERDSSMMLYLLSMKSMY